MGAAALAVAPFAGAVSLVFLFVLLKYIVLSQSMNLIAGYTGYVDFGHVAWFGLGTYVTGILLKLGLGLTPIVPAVMGGFFAAAVAALVGIPLLRLRGPYFSISMLVFSESVKILIILLEPITGGVYGIALPRIYNPQAAYYALLALSVAFVILLRYLAVSRFGIMLKAIREDEEAASVLGVNTTFYKVAAFAASAFFAGIVGGLDFWFVAYAAPELVFPIVLTIEMTVMMLFGGAGTVLGPILGAVSLYLVRDFLWIRFPFIYLMIFGAIIVGSVIFMPRGVLGLMEARFTELRGKVK